MIKDTTKSVKIREFQKNVVKKAHSNVGSFFTALSEHFPELRNNFKNITGYSQSSYYHWKRGEKITIRVILLISEVTGIKTDIIINNQFDKVNLNVVKKKIRTHLANLETPAL